MILFVLFVAVFVIGGAAVCFCVDTGYRPSPSVRRIVSGVMLAVVLTVGAVKLYAAEISYHSHQEQCNALEKYSFFWYAFGCFVYEGSS